jgi:hypothetical protein
MAIDRSSWLWRKGRPLAVCAGVMLASGVTLQPLQSAVWHEVSIRQSSLNLKDLGENVSQGMLLGVLGGFRSILADMVWIKNYTYWEKRDRANTEASIALAATIDPSNLMFWDEGSSMIGLDIPSWARRATPPLSDAELDKVMRVQALRAIDFINRGLKFVPDNYRLYMDKAQLYQNRLRDLPQAAESYRLAAESNPRNPFLAARSYIRLLRQMHRDQEAYDYMLKYYPTLHDNVPDVQKELMWGWIRGLEDVLKIPPEKRLPDSMAPPNWNAKDYMDDFEDLSTKKFDN